MESIINTAIRTAIIYFSLLYLCRLMGRKMISQMTFFDFVVGITIGSVAANSNLGPYNDSLPAGLSSLVMLTVLVLAIDFLHIKSFKFRKIVDSEPIVVIERGQIVDQNLRRERFTLKELNALLREKNIFTMADVEFAILEHDGKLSVLPKSHRQYLRPSDMNIQTQYQGLCKDIIIDGVIMKENLKDGKLTEEWLMNQLKNQGITDVKDVFYAGVNSAKNLYISKRNVKQEKHGKYGIE